MDSNIKIVVQALADDGVFPNNAQLPLIVYREAVETSIRVRTSFQQEATR